ncbi:hypothetical protein [Mycolicibacterium arseniciresistens]|uniref:Tyr recombinase domain-containing protein n=1 Tax=Mycolicibacterium arseniciresistens TaxID=3062257 RepID=A0ABT8UEA6_9MYCO|nr:hypothetical protein [Mycolicibacterium arseniciresistens]MDO3635501.1 hypothetical protein [Mycolicibacterium arseniciresistens]
MRARGANGFVCDRGRGLSAGVNVLALQRMLGHKSAKVTLDTYANLYDDDVDAVGAAFHAR